MFLVFKSFFLVCLTEGEVACLEGGGGGGGGMEGCCGRKITRSCLTLGGMLCSYLAIGFSRPVDCTGTPKDES